MVGFQRVSIVREDGRQIVTAHIDYPGGAGIRIYPAALMKPELGYRPADEDRRRACDTSILTNLPPLHRHRESRSSIGTITTGRSSTGRARTRS